MTQIYPLGRGMRCTCGLARRWGGAAALVGALFLCAVMNAQQTDRARQIGKRLMCVCGCNQVLTECNHVGCTYSHSMLKELDDRVAQGSTDDLVVQSFVQEYGTTVELVPPATGFNRWMWIMPVLLPLAGLWLAQRAIVKWRKRGADASEVAMPAELMERARRESRVDGDA
jgi:cytochrome c-type biogenesis protein CcmH/NrfF